MADHTTTRFGLTGFDPTGSELVTNLPTRANAMLDQIDVNMFGWASGVFASRPAAGHAGHTYFATDDTTGGANGTLYFDDGTAWNVGIHDGDPGRVGDIIMNAATSAPTAKWLACDGASESRTTYAALFAKIGTTYGSVDGTHFTLPDLRGRSAIGSGTGAGLTARTAGQAGGEEAHTIARSELPAGAVTLPSGSFASWQISQSAPGGAVYWVPTATSATWSGGSGTAANVMQPWAAIPHYIRALP